MPIFKGAGVAIVTPMKDNFEVDYERLEENINYQIDNGTDCIVIAGTTGEGSTLTEREQKVLRLRFGMNDGRARTLEEVGREFDVTRERIRQIEAKALRKLRHPSRSRKLRDYLD